MTNQRATEFPQDNTETMSRSDLAEMGLSIPDGWDVGTRLDPRDDGWVLVAMVADQDCLIYEAELEVDQEPTEGDYTEVCTEAVLAALKQEGI